MAAEAGVKIVLGTDASDFAPFGRNALELELLVEAGVAPVDALRAGTSVAADAGTATARISGGSSALASYPPSCASTTTSKGGQSRAFELMTPGRAACDVFNGAVERVRE